MPRSLVSELRRPQDARAEAAILREVLEEAWEERRRLPRASGDRAFVEVVIRDLVEQLRRLG